MTVLFIHTSYIHKERVDESQSLTLESIRHSLIRQEDSIIFSLLGRAQYCYSEDTYACTAFFMEGFPGSLVGFMVTETEKASMPTWEDTTALMSILFFQQSYPNHCFHLYGIHRPIVLAHQLIQFFGMVTCRHVLHPCADSININKKALSKRIHYGKFVDRQNSENHLPATRLPLDCKYTSSSRNALFCYFPYDGARLMELLTYETVEAVI
ncbi:hypothetical protein RJ639_040182 [Escallonia herrerae]|uniref:chorismate mutase n=1 Tax=Escallonia herrerae TaxID=1293975 RepID=A0AA88WIJ4_9ASTE|nr:hypothetical protein RJ639_040182 [Escallonia herrerae]